MNRLKQKMKTFSKVVGAYANWPRVAFYRQGWITTPFVLKGRDGGLVKIRDTGANQPDLYVANESWVYKLHDELLPYMKDAKVGIDIGGHIGTFTIWAAMHSPAKIYVVEPSESNLEILKENIALNDLQDRVTIVPGLIAKETGSKDVYITENSGFVSTIKEHHENRPDAGKLLSVVNTPAISLKDMFEKYKIDVCDFMKVDVEGGEYDIFMNLPDDVYARIRSINIEISSREEELTQYIANKGFKVLLPNPEHGGEYIFIK